MNISRLTESVVCGLPCIAWTGTFELDVEREEWLESIRQ